MTTAPRPDEGVVPPMGERGRARSVLGLLLLTVIIAAAYYLLARFGLHFFSADSKIAHLWPAAGMFAAALIMLPPREWPLPVATVAVVVFFANAASGLPPAACLGFAAANCTESMLVAIIYRRLAPTPASLSSLRHVWSFLLAAIAGPALAGILGAGNIALIMEAPFADAWWNWLTVDGAGILVVTPTLLAWRPLASEDEKTPAGWTETAAAVALLLLMLDLTAELIPFFDLPHELPFVVYIPLLWLALRAHARAVTAAAAMVSVILLNVTVRGTGPFIGFMGSSIEAAILRCQHYIFVLYGAALLTHAAMQDARRQARLARESGRTIRDIVNNSSAVIFLKDREGRYLLVNRLYEEFFGVKDDDIKGKTDFAIFPPSDAAAFQENDRAVIAAGKPLQFEERVPHRDGMHTYLSVKFPLHDESGRAIAVCGIATDISARHANEARLKASEQRNRELLAESEEARRALLGILEDQQLTEEALRESTRRFRTFIDFTADWESWRRQDGRFEYVSPSCEKITGYTAEEFIRDNELETRIVHDADKAAYEEHISIHGGGDARDSEIQYRIVRKDGQERWIHHVCHSVLGDGGEFMGRRISNRDVTDRKNAEQALIASERRAVAGQLAAGVAHEFNNILQICKLQSQIGQVEIEEGNAHNLADHLRVIEENIERGAGIVRNLIALVKPMERKREEVPLAALLRREIMAHEKILSLENVTLHMDCDPAVLDRQVSVDTDAVAQVLLNLVLNARDAMRPGGGEIRIEAGLEAPCRDRPAGGAVVTIRDSGHGISRDALQKLFTPFFTTKGAFASDNQGLKGTGLGLAVSQKVMREMGGDLRASSEGEGRGSAFTMILPLAVPTPAPPTAADVTAKAKPSAKKIRGLLVDDEIEYVNRLRDWLAKRGHDVTAYSDSESALLHIESAAAGTYDVLLTDLLMPGVNGTALAKSALERGVVARAVFLSGLLDDELEHMTADIPEKSRCCFLKKPVDLSELLAVLQKTED